MRASADNSARAIPLLTLVLIAFGMLLRVVQYLSNRSLWLDEVFLSSAIFETPYRQMLQQPLPYMQVAPPAYLWLQKLIVDAGGRSEWVLRALPLAAGLASVPLYYLLVKRFLEPAASALAVAFFALSANLVYYSSEVKPYGCDVATAIVLALVLMGMPGAALGPRRLFGYSLLGAFAVWFSYPAGIILAALMVWTALVCLHRGDPKRIVLLAPVWLAWLASFSVLYLACLGTMAHNQHLRQGYAHFWESRFPLAAPGAWDGLAQWVRLFVGSFQDPAALHTPALAAVLFLVGTAGLFKAAGRRALAVFLPVLLTLFVSAFGWIPFGNRNILFLVPFLLLPVAAGVWWLGVLSRRFLRLAGWAAAAVLAGPVFIIAGNLLFYPVQVEELKPVLAHVSRSRRPSDAVYVYHWSQYPFRYYSARYGFDPASVIIGKPLDEPTAQQQLQALLQRGRAWVIVSHGHRWQAPQDERRLLEWFNSYGRLVDQVRAVGAGAYLYQFANSALDATP